MTNTQKIIELLKTGRKFHSRELFSATSWDFRKYVSNAKKELKNDYEWHTEQADKGMKYYWITPICDAQRVFGGDNHSTDCETIALR